MEVQVASKRPETRPRPDLSRTSMAAKVEAARPASTWPPVKRTAVGVRQKSKTDL